LILIACGALGFFASKIKLEEDITRFVPSDKNSQSINSILDNLKSKDKLIVHASTKNGENRALSYFFYILFSKITEKTKIFKNFGYLFGSINSIN
jgi:hypothetical protein